MTPRERFLATFRDGEVGAAPRYERPIADETVAAWRKQGHIRDVDPVARFDLDRWLLPAVGVGPQFNLRAMPDLDRVVASPDDVPDWLGRHRPENRLPEDWSAAAAELVERDVPLGLQVFRGLFLTFGVRDGDSLVDFCYFLADHPDLMAEMLGHLAALTGGLLRQIAEVVVPDFLLFGEPIAGGGGPVIGPHTFRDVVASYYREVIETGRELGVPVFVWESYGAIEPLLPEVIAAGCDVVWIGHAAAHGVDYRRLREQYPDLGLIGGLDSRLLRLPPLAMATHVRHVCRALLPGGRYAPALDDRVRADIPYGAFATYRAAVDRELPGIER